MSKLGNFIKNIGRAFKKAVTSTRESVEKAFNALRRDKSIGEFEQRFSPRRVLGGFRLMRTGKHRGSKAGCLGPQQRAGLPGDKLWRKAAEGKL